MQILVIFPQSASLATLLPCRQLTTTRTRTRTRWEQHQGEGVIMIGAWMITELYLSSDLLQSTCPSHYEPANQSP